jgi:hypothetical protein
LDSVATAQIPTTRSRLDGVSSTKEDIQNEILEILKKSPQTPTQLSNHFHQSRENFSREYLYPLKEAKKIIKVDGSNYYQLPLQKNTSRSIKKALLSESEIFETDSFKSWISNNTSKDINHKHIGFARICLGLTTPKFKIHPDNITSENWKEIVKNIVDALLENPNYEVENGEPHWGLRQCIRGFLQDGLGIKISKKEGINLRISGTKPKPKSADLHITPEQIILAKDSLKKKFNLEWFLKFGVKTWTFVRPSTIYLIELEHMEFSDQVVEYVEGKDGKKITDSKVVEYAKFKGDTVFSYARRICHIEVHEHKTDSDFDKYILDPDFVEPLEKFYNIRKSQRKKYLFWEDNQTKFTFENYRPIVQHKVATDNKFFKIVLSEIGFEKSDFGIYFRANYGFRHFGIQMWLIATDYNYNLVSEMSHEGTETLKKWYGKRTQKDFQRKIKGIMMN